MAFLTTIFSMLNPPNYNRLEYLLESARTDDSSRDEFYRLLMTSELCVPGEIHNGEMFIRPYDLDGRKALLVFTSQKRMGEGLRERPASFTIAARTLFAALPAFDMLVLNYRTRTQKQFTPSEIRGLLDGSIFERNGQGNSEIILGQPKVYPVRLMEALKEKLPARSEVRAAYLAQRFNPETMTEPQIVIAFDTDMNAADFEAFTANAVRLADACGAQDVAFIRLEDDATGEYMQQEGRAFYRYGD